VVGAATVVGLAPPLIGGWVSGTIVAGAVVPDGRVVGVTDVGASEVVGATVVVCVVSLPLRTTTVAIPAPKTPMISTISAMVRSRLR
jgi:hypothetical protein